MKKQKPKKRSQVQREDDDFVRYWTHGKRPHTNVPMKNRTENIFVRVSKPMRMRKFVEAGYFSVSADAMKWTEIHSWLQENLPNRYTWFGEVFWFLTKEDRDRFANEFGFPDPNGAKFAFMHE